MALTLATALDARNNNFDVIRFIAAIMVIFAHSYPLTYNHDDYELLNQITNHQMTFGTLGVAIFFIISGFLIFQSYTHAPNILVYTKARCLRIFPALIVVLVLTTFIFGPLMTELSMTEYFHSPLIYTYLSGVLLFPVYYDLPGVFAHNPYPNIVNGSLWTIPYEVVCYILLAILGIMRILRFSWILLLSLLMIFIFRLIWFDVSPELQNQLKIWFYGLGLGKTIELGSYFLAGMVIYAYRDRIVLHYYLAILSIIILLLATIFGGLQAWFLLAGSYLIIYIGFAPWLRCHNFARYGDFSYGIYIYAFPIQQSLVYFSGANWHPLLNALLTIPLVLICAFLSWHLVESKALRLKKVILISSKLRI